MQHTWSPEDGTTAVEYGIISVFIGIALVAVGPWLVQVMIDLISTIVGGMQ